MKSHINRINNKKHIKSRHKSKYTKRKYNKTDIPKIIHQVFYDVGLGELKDKPIYLKSIENIKKYNPKKDGWKHCLWTKSKAEKMIKKSFPDYWTFYNSLPSEWYRMELVRYFAVAKYGGFYIDLDMFCKKSLNPLCKNEYVVHSHKGRHWKGGGKCNFSENNFFAFKPRYLMSILKY